MRKGLEERALLPLAPSKPICCPRCGSVSIRVKYKAMWECQTCFWFFDFIFSVGSSHVEISPAQEEELEERFFADLQGSLVRASLSKERTRPLGPRKFRSRLRKSAGWGLKRGQVRRSSPFGITQCPTTGLASDQGLGLFFLRDWVIAGKRLGLDDLFIRDITTVSDGVPRESSLKELRREILADLKIGLGGPFQMQEPGGTTPDFGPEDIEVVRILSWKDLVAELRAVSLLGDRKIFPYAQAKIESHIVDLEKTCPLARYVVTERVDFQAKLRAALLEKYGLDVIDIFDLAGVLEFRLGGEVWRMIPSLIEVYTETQGDLKGEEVWALVDGAHRASLAFDLGKKSTRVVAIRNVPAHLPLIALPLNWGDMQRVEKVPSLSEKRQYRFPTLDSAPDISRFSDLELSEENFAYFFYRDLALLGSSGIREPSPSIDGKGGG